MRSVAYLIIIHNTKHSSDGNWEIPIFQMKVSFLNSEIWVLPAGLLWAYVTFQRSRSHSRLLKVGVNLEKHSWQLPVLWNAVAGYKLLSKQGSLLKHRCPLLSELLEFLLQKTSDTVSTGILAPVRVINCSRGMRGLGSVKVPTERC